MTHGVPDLKELIKQRLFGCISAQLDQIGYVPEDLARLTAGVDFNASSVGHLEPQERVVAPDERDAPSVAADVNRYYDHIFYDRQGIMALAFDASDYRNLGYWDETTKTLNEASERLQDKLMDFIPEKTGRILDVACGMGASTRRLLNSYPAENVWAINISEKQIETTRENAPGCNASVMNATEMTFEDEFFDNILCIEAAFHFETRRKFLESALRILKPGGRLVISDVLFTSQQRLSQFPLFPTPRNHLADAEEYRALLADVGFSDIVVQDVTRPVWRAHFLNVVTRVHERFHDGDLDLVHLNEVLWMYYLMDSITGPCVFVSAQK